MGRGLGLSEADCRLEHWHLCDPHLARLVKGAAQKAGRERPVVAYPYSPLVADPLGLWAAELGGPICGPAILPRSTAGKTLGWKEKDREIIFHRTVEPYYELLEQTVREALRASPLVLVLTLRSFNSIPLEFEKSRAYPRPQIVVNSAGGLTPKGLTGLAFGTFRAFHWWVEQSWPQTGSAWLPPHLRTLPRVKALGLSLCRGLYMDERNGEPKESLVGARRILGTLFNLLEQEMDRVSQVRLSRVEEEKKKSPVIKAARR